MSWVRAWVVAWLVAVAVIAASATSADARPVEQVHLGSGSLKGRACMLPPSGVIKCFATQADLRARSDAMRANRPANGRAVGLANGLASGLVSGQVNVGCPVLLFSGAGYTGNVLEVWPQGYWVNLADYGFSDATMSFYGTGCSFHLAEYAWGGGGWYPGYTGPWAWASDMGPSWDWRVSSMFID